MPVTLPTTRKDLEIITRIAKRGEFRYFIKDPRSEEIFDMGEAEYFLWKRMDGQTPLNYVRSVFQNRFGILLELDQLEAFARKLQSMGLLESGKDEFDDTQPMKAPIKRIPLGNPNGLLAVIADWIGWCFSRFFFVAVLVISALLLGVCIKYFSDILSQIRLFKFYWGPIIYLMIPALSIFVIEPLSELAKGIACRHYRTPVYECGVFQKYKVLSIFYVDISDALWMLPKAEQLKVFSAGLICRLLLWDLSILAWKNASAGSNLEVFWLLFLIASTVALVLSLIPLTERDGYQLLSIWKEKDDLKERAVALTKAWLFKYPVPEPLSPREISGFKWYGMLWMGFQLVFWGFLLGFAGYFLATSLNGVGAIIFMGILYCRFGYLMDGLFIRIQPVKKIVMRHSPAFIRLRLLVRYGLLIVLIIVALLPYPFMAGGDFRLLPVKQVGIRSQVTGEIEAVFVTEGQWVEMGDPVAKLTGRDQKKKVESTKAALDQTQAKLKLLRKGAKPEAIAAAKQEVKTAAKSLEYSTMAAARYAKLIKDNAASIQNYENALKVRDLDRERLELSKRNLEYVESGAREEEIQAVEAEVRRLEVELRHAEEDLELTLLTSPIAGQIITPNLSQKIGQILIEGDLFAVVEDSRKIIAEIEVPEEDIGEVPIGSKVRLKLWGYPTKAFRGKVVAIAPVAYEKSIERVERTLSEREQLYGRNQRLREEGQVVRVLTEVPNEDGFLKTDMTGYAKIDSENKPVIVAFTRWLVRFVLIEVWSWIP